MIKKTFRVIIQILVVLVGLIALLVVGVVIFVNTAPQIGKAPEGEDLATIKLSPHYKDGVFVNNIETTLGSFGDMLDVVPDMLFGKNQSPEKPLPTKFGNFDNAKIDSICAVTWFGHSAFLLEIEGSKVLLDPMLGPVSAPVSFGTKRFAYDKPIPLDKIDDIDVVVISHDHYDHLDYPTILMLKDKAHLFITPKGVGSHLRYWGVSPDKVRELDWWEQTTFKEIEFVACPARHFSGRGLTDRNATQWASWAILGKHQRLYFSGDGGYGPHFKTIGEKYGPFDLAMLECGQYNTAWADIHMMPEESVQAGIDVKGKLLMPIHWGAFRLAVHEWTDPIDRFKSTCQQENIDYIHPIIGERVVLGQAYQNTEWWTGLSKIQE